MEIQHEASSIPMTSSEIAYLWKTYILNSKSKQILMYYVAQCDDKDIRSVLQLSLDLSSKVLSDVKTIFDSVKQSVPYGFSEGDTYVNAPKVYSDKLMLYTLRVFSAVALSVYGMAVSLSPRQDVRKFFTDILISDIDLINKIDDIELEKGIYIRTPNIPITEKVEFAEDKSIMGRIIGHRRPLNASEIASIFNCSMVDSIYAAYYLGLSQTIEDDRLKDFINRTRNTLREHCDTLNEILHKEDLSFPASLESEVLNTSTPIHSDRLSMFCFYSTLIEISYNLSIAKVETMRKDVFMVLTQLSSDVLFLLKDTTDLMLERNWFEEMPKNIDRGDIVNKS